MQEYSSSQPTIGFIHNALTSEYPTCKFSFASHVIQIGRSICQTVGMNHLLVGSNAGYFSHSRLAFCKHVNAVITRQPRRSLRENKLSKGRPWVANNILLTCLVGGRRIFIAGLLVGNNSTTVAQLQITTVQSNQQCCSSPNTAVNFF